MMPLWIRRLYIYMLKGHKVGDIRMFPTCDGDAFVFARPMPIPTISVQEFIDVHLRRDNQDEINS